MPFECSRGEIPENGTLSQVENALISAALASYAGRIWTVGMAFDAFLAVLRVINERQCSTITSN